MNNQQKGILFGALVAVAAWTPFWIYRLTRPTVKPETPERLSIQSLTLTNANVGTRKEPMNEPVDHGYTNIVVQNFVARTNDALPVWYVSIPGLNCRIIKVRASDELTAIIHASAATVFSEKDWDNRARKFLDLSKFTIEDRTK